MESLNLKKIEVKGFWKEKMEIVRKNVIPYQWESINDRVPDASPSYCIHNFKVAAKIKEQKKNKDFKAPSYTFRGFEVLPEYPVIKKSLYRVKRLYIMSIPILLILKKV